MEEEEAKVLAFKNAIDHGVRSGPAKDFDPKEHLASLKAKRGLSGSLLFDQYSSR